MAQAVGLGMRTFLPAAFRVVESAFELSDEAIEAQIQSVVCQFEMLKEENRRLAETISEQDKIIEKLQEDLDQYSTR
ncbi:PREDICTED: voltage-gated hydrogen channel [Prunus dulcis]|uniref:PREDICTED: voltage-gated hydrogen channel n=1 Tax=Prunus dulcis TaxID=3755 RepID=A0A5E4G9K4_PRUDU|nr:PREDICTED: voltage-gated hydrogen channel [Prunus dulcis]